MCTEPEDSEMMDMCEMCGGANHQADFDRFLHAQVEEMQKYKWCMGVQLNHDPLQDRSFDDICAEWISKYAADFRNKWSHYN